MADIELGLQSQNDESKTFMDSYSQTTTEVSAIDNHDGTYEVILMDISCDKKWIAYVSYKRLANNLRGYEMDGSNRRIFITRRKFTEIGGKVEHPFENPSSLDITSVVVKNRKTHCKFLSISPNGKYIALSFYERTKEGDADTKYWRPVNPKCYIFKVDSLGKLSLYNDKLKCDGRAVFFHATRNSLAMINTNVMEVHDNFPGDKSVSYVLDLSPFFWTGQSHEDFEIDETYFQNVSWADFDKAEITQEMKIIIQLSRHIRHNILSTKFIGGITRVWSIEDGVRLTSFSAKNQNVAAFSKNYKYAATFVKATRSINIYNVKSGLLVYCLKSQQDLNKEFEVSHIRFCYDGRYVAMSGLQGENVVFEVWYVEAEKSIYLTNDGLIKTVKPSYRTAVDDESKEGYQIKNIQPFVVRTTIRNNEKCLMGVYTSIEGQNIITKTMELDIDRLRDRSSTEIVDNEISIEWMSYTNETQPYVAEGYELSNNLKNYDKLKCGYLNIDGKQFLIRFGAYTVQLWYLFDPGCSSNTAISDKDELLYIRAYKGPDYGINYSFRENWKIHGFASIKFIGGMASGRILVNISEDETDGNVLNHYHTEELFLPIDEIRSATVTTAVITDTKVSSKKFDYHKLESACQALHYLGNVKTELENKDNYDMILGKTESLIRSAVKNIDEESNFFSTIAGSRTLAMLASFKSGRDIIKLIVAEGIPISIFSYARTIAAQPKMDSDEKYMNEKKQALFKFFGYAAKRNKKNEHEESFSNVLTYRSSDPNLLTEEPRKVDPIVGNENVLTVLIETLNYDMYSLLFNRILSDAKRLGPGCLSALTDALLFLQEEDNADLLLTSSQKLSFLVIDKTKLGILQSELNQSIKVKTMQKEYISSLRNLETHATMEQIDKYSGFSLFIFRLEKMVYQWDRLNRLKNFIEIACRYYKKQLFKKSQKEPRGAAKVCVVPLPHFNTYSNLPEDRPKNLKYDVDSLITYKKQSAFIRVAIDQNANNIFQQGDTVLEVMLQYKWEQFGRWRFWCIYAIHIIFYVSYATGVLFPQELYGYESGPFKIQAPGQIASVVLMCVAVLVLIIQEFRQFFKTRSVYNYFSSGYNWVDMAAYAFPIFTLLQLRFGWPYFNEVCSVSNLVLFAHGILRLRVIPFFGITLEIIIQLCKNVFTVFTIMVIVIFGFTISYILALRLEPDEFFQENYSGTYTNTGSDEVSGVINFVDVSSDNGFQNWFKAFSQVWFFVHGVWDPLNDGDAGDSKFLMCLSIFFSLITIVIFFNLLIALMASTAEEVQSRGKRVWVSHFAAVVSEIENLWCFSSAKHSRKNNPSYIYYISTEKSVLEHEEKLQKETSMLSKKLGIFSNNSCNCHSIQ